MPSLAETLPALQQAVNFAVQFLNDGGPAMWAIGVLSVVMVALILWKLLRLLAFGAWSGGGATTRAVRMWQSNDHDGALAVLQGRHSLRAKLARTAMTASVDPTLSQEAAEAETARVARGLLMQARAGLRPLELISTVAPLLGLLGTVLGMIAAFQTLQEAGARADPATLAGGIWEALLTTAAGMTVAIPASAALTWFESIVDRLRHDLEDIATRILLRGHEITRPDELDPPVPLSRHALKDR